MTTRRRPAKLGQRETDARSPAAGRSQRCHARGVDPLSFHRRSTRARLADKVEQQRRREQAELDHIVAFEAAAGRRAAAEAEMAVAVAALIRLGNTVTTTAQLTAQTPAEIRRLRKLAATPADTGNDTTDSDGDPGDTDTEQAAPQVRDQPQPAGGRPA